MARSRVQRLSISVSKKSLTKALFGKSTKKDLLTSTLSERELGAKLADFYWTKTVEPALVKDYKDFRKNGLRALANEKRNGAGFPDSLNVRGFANIAHPEWEPLEPSYYRKKVDKRFRANTGETNKALTLSMDTVGTSKGVQRSKRVNSVPKVKGGRVSIGVNYSYTYTAPAKDTALSAFLMHRYLEPDAIGGDLVLGGALKKLAFFENGTKTKRREQSARPLFDPVSRAYGFRRRKVLKKALKV